MSTSYHPKRSLIEQRAPVHIEGNQGDHNIQTGRAKPPLFAIEELQSINILVDGKDRLPNASNARPSAYRISMNGNLFRARACQVQKVIIPKPPNITPFNNQLVVTLTEGNNSNTQTITLNVGFYNTTSIANELMNELNGAAWAGSPGAFTAAPNFTVSFDPVTQRFTIIENNGISITFPSNSASTFLIRGGSMIPFKYPDTDGTATKISGPAGMIYTRYLVISSEELNQYSYTDSKTSRNGLGGDAIAMVNMTDAYTVSDFDVSVPFSGAYITVNTSLDAPKINLCNSQNNTNDQIDIYIQDEWGESYDDLFVFGDEATDGVAENNLGSSLWLKVWF